VTVSDTRMLTPPPVSGKSYPITGTAEERSNYVLAGLTFNVAHSNNVLGETDIHPAGDVSYSIWPTIALDETTARLRATIDYSPGFTFYQRISQRDETDQNLGLDLQYRLSQHVTAALRDSFRKSSSVFNQPDLMSGVSVSGVPQTPTVAVIAPVTDILCNTGNAELTYQMAANSMVGVEGTFTNLHLHYPSLAQVPGLYDSSSRGGSAFYSHRVARWHYIGAIYEYDRSLIFPTGAQDETQTNTVFLFYTVYLRPTFSLSLIAGPQHYRVDQPPLAPFSAWSPAAAASLSWQGRHASLAAAYSYLVTSGGGLLGTFHSDNANVEARWQMTRNWRAGLAANYSVFKNLIPSLLLLTPGGHSVKGTVSFDRRLMEHWDVEAGYTWLRQSYGGTATSSIIPDVNREFISVSYNFARSIGK
jgi:hypothetical protein